MAALPSGYSGAVIAALPSAVPQIDLVSDEEEEKVHEKLREEDETYRMSDAEEDTRVSEFFRYKHMKIQERKRLERETEIVLSGEKAKELRRTMRRGLEWGNLEVLWKKRKRVDVQRELDAWLNTEFKKLGVKLVGGRETAEWRKLEEAVGDGNLKRARGVRVGVENYPSGCA